MKQILLLPHIKVQNANALSSPYTIGFPAMTAWLGVVHALQRKINHGAHVEFKDYKFIRVGVACHDLNLHTYKGHGDYVFSIVGTGNPLDKDGDRSSFIEEARCDLDVSILIEVNDIPVGEDKNLVDWVSNYLPTLKIAGGDILSFDNPVVVNIDHHDSFRKLMRKLMPSYVIVERKDLMLSAMNDGQDSIDALLEYLTVQHRCVKTDNDEIEWIKKRKISGWIVPIAIGFLGINELAYIENQRDSNTLHRFAESVITLGEFVMSYRLKNIDELLWQYHFDAVNSLYVCQQNRSSHSF